MEENVFHQLNEKYLVKRIGTDQEKEEKYNLEDLPEDALYIIGEYLGPRELILSMRVCRRWNTLFRSDDMWKRIYNKKYHLDQSITIYKDYPLTDIYEMIKWKTEAKNENLLVEEFKTIYPEEINEEYYKQFKKEVSLQYEFCEEGNSMSRSMKLEGTLINCWDFCCCFTLLMFASHILFWLTIGMTLDSIMTFKLGGILLMVASCIYGTLSFSQHIIAIIVGLRVAYYQKKLIGHVKLIKYDYARSYVTGSHIVMSLISMMDIFGETIFRVLVGVKWLGIPITYTQAYISGMVKFSLFFYILCLLPCIGILLSLILGPRLGVQPLLNIFCVVIINCWTAILQILLYFIQYILFVQKLDGKLPNSPWATIFIPYYIILVNSCCLSVCNCMTRCDKNKSKSFLKISRPFSFLTGIIGTILLIIKLHEALPTYFYYTYIMIFFICQYGMGIVIQSNLANIAPSGNYLKFLAKGIEERYYHMKNTFELTSSNQPISTSEVTESDHEEMDERLDRLEEQLRIWEHFQENNVDVDSSFSMTDPTTSTLPSTTSESIFHSSDSEDLHL